jgi:serine protease inhibitor
MAFMLDRGDWENNKYLVVNQSIPKFDVTSQIDLRAGLQALGVTDVFDPALSDYTPMTTDRSDIFLSKAQHDALVIIDEEGVEAAAYTVLANPGASMPPQAEIDFVVDRPFLFLITGADGLPLFIGMVNHP